MNERVKVVVADITKMEVDAIVNAANEGCLGGGGVDGAIHRAAGAALRRECLKLAEVRPGVRCPTGEARITDAGNLPCRKVIHTVGPDCRVYIDETEQDRLLASAYSSSLGLASANGLKTIAFPSISTGVFGFPLERAARIAASVIVDFLAKTPELSVTMCILVPGMDDLQDKVVSAYRNAFDGWNSCATVAELAHEMHKRDTAPREDSGLPYITHPARVVEMLRSWGYQDGVEPLIVALGWAHDLKEDTRVTDEQIVKAGGPFGERLLVGVNALTFETFSESRTASESDEEHQARKAEYIRHVAEGELDFLVVKIADRICNTMERAETDPVRARGYLKKGEALFARIGELKHGDRVRKTLEEIRARVGG